MHKLGSILAFVFNKVFILALVFMFIAGLPIIGVASTFTDRQAVKDILNEANVYSTTPDNILDIVSLEDGSADLEQPEQQQNQPGPDGIPGEFQPGPDEMQATKKNTRTVRVALEENGVIDPDELIKTVKATLDAKFLEETASNVIDGVYNFLDESSETLEFELTLRDRSDVASTELKSFLSSSLLDLPTCSEDQFNDSDDIEILDIDCLPPGINIEEEINKFIDELTAEDGIFGKIYTPEDLEISEADLVLAQVGYQALSSFASLFWMITIGLSFAVILTSKTTHRGFKEIGIIYALLGFIFLIAFGSVATSLDLGEMVIENGDEFSEQQEQAIRNIAEPVADALITQISSHIVVISIAMIIIGVASFVFGIVLTKHHVEHLQFHHEPDDEEQKTIDELYPEPTKGRSKPPEKQLEPKKKPATKATASKKKPKKKIQ